MATASTSGQSGFGLGRKKKSPGLMDQIGQFFGGNKKKRSKGSFRGHLATSPQQSSSRRRTNENAVVHFFRSLVSSPPAKSRWKDILGLSDSLLLDDFETARLFINRPHRHVPRAQSPQSGDAGTKAHCPGSSLCDDLSRSEESPSPNLPQNAGAPSSEDKITGGTPKGPEEKGKADSQPEEMLTD
uniref:Myelin basic protein n=1 Tax=Oryzias latipes TaxID=8090 RepID=A0A3P9IYT6_ORYLA